MSKTDGEKQRGADVGIGIRGSVVHVAIESTTVQSIVPVTTNVGEAVASNKPYMDNITHANAKGKPKANSSYG